MKDLEKVAQFYNEYQVINFGDEEAMKSQGKVFMKQMNELVDIVIPCLVRIGTKESKELPKGTEMPAGIVLSTLITNNLEHAKLYQKCTCKIKTSKPSRMRSTFKLGLKN